MKQIPPLGKAHSPQETITDIYCITMLFLFPLFPGFSGYTNITFSKFVFLLTATGLWLAALLLASLRHPTPLPRLGAAQYCALAFLLISVLSALCSPNFTDTLLGAGRYDGLLTTAIYCLIFLGVSMFTRPKLLHAYALGAAVTLCCALAFLQLLGHNPLNLYPAGLLYADRGIRYSGSYLGTIGNTNLLDAFLCLAIPALFYLAFILRHRLFLLPLFCAVATVIIAGGTGAHFALCAVFLAALIILPRSHKGRIRGCLVAATIVISALLLLWFWPGQNGTLIELSNILHGHLEDSYGSSRIRIWRGCLALFPEHPLLGGGPGTLAQRLDISFSRYVPETGATLRSYVDNAHNIYLGHLINTGVLGVLAYLSLLLSSVYGALRRSYQNGCYTACALCVFCAAVHGFFGLGLCLTEPMFFLLLAFCVPCSTTSLEEDLQCKTNSDYT